MHVSSETLLRWHTALERPDTRGPAMREIFQCYLDAMRTECVERGSGERPRADRDELEEAAA